jgi:hypothetical protein
MDEIKLRDKVKSLVDCNGLQEVLAALAADVKQRESVIEEKNNQELGLAFEILFQTVMELLPEAKKKTQNFASAVLKAPVIKSALKTIMADHEYSSPATKKAYAAWLDLF